MVVAIILIWLAVFSSPASASFSGLIGRLATILKTVFSLPSGGSSTPPPVASQPQPVSTGSIPTNCSGTTTAYRCLELIPNGGTVLAGSSVTAYAKASMVPTPTAPRAIYFDVEARPNGVNILWSDGPSCAIPSGQSSCGVHVTFETAPTTSGQKYFIPVIIDPTPAQNYELTVTKPKNNSPSVTPLTPYQTDYCVSPLGWILSWNFSDPENDVEGAYQIKVIDNSTGRLVVNRLVYSASNSLAIPVGTLDFNKTYSWRVKVWDSQFNPSAEVAGADFKTIANPPPAVDFNWQFSGGFPAVGELITFNSQTIFSGPVSGRSWLWNFYGDLAPVGFINQPKTQARAGSMGEKQVTLWATDAAGLTCSKTKNITVGHSVPRIQEIFPR